MFINYMDDRRYLAYGFVIEYLDAVSFTSLTCVCKDLKEYNNIYPEYFKDPQPTRSTIVNVLPTFLKFELDCVAYAPNTRQEG